MSDAPFLPPELLPRDRMYRPAQRGYVWRLFKKIIYFGLLWIIVTATFSVLGHFVWLPLGQTELAYIAAVVFIGLGSIFMLRRVRRHHALLTEIQEATALLESGTLEEAGKILDGCCANPAIAPPLHAFAVFDRAYVFLRAGRIDQALSLFASVYECGWMAAPQNSLYLNYPLLLGGIATCYVIKGDVEYAEKWRDVAHEHVSAGRSGLLLPLDTLVGIRCGRYAVVVQDAEQAWAGAEGCLSGTNLKTLRMLCAFALSHINQNGVQDANIRRYLDGVNPVQAGQFDYLAGKWPELKAFLVANGFTDVK